MSPASSLSDAQASPDAMLLSHSISVTSSATEEGNPAVGGVHPGGSTLSAPNGIGQTNDDGDCEAMLDTLDSCVACVEGVDIQNQYEDQLLLRASAKREAAVKHGLSEAEAAMVRLQIMEEAQKKGTAGAPSKTRAPAGGKNKADREEADAISSMIPDIDDLNICGADIDLPSQGAAAAKARSAPAKASGMCASACSKMPTDEMDGEQPAPARPQNGTSAYHSGQPSTLAQCAICFDEAKGENGTASESIVASTPAGKTSAVSFANLPCCGSKEREGASSAMVCTACVLLLTTPTSDGKARVGRCPCCRSWISVTTADYPTPADPGQASNAGISSTGLSTASSSLVVPNITITAVSSAGKCKVCNQMKSHLVDSHGTVCDACYLGRRRPLLYECEQCHSTQKIPHPMYRYQEKMDVFGKTSWACQVKCQHFTMWRILADQVRLIPVGDAPAEWEQDFLEVARTSVMEARRGIAAGDTDGGDVDGGGAGSSSSCAIS